MSRSIRSAIGLATAVGLLAGASQAHAVTFPVAASCDFPLVGAVNGTITTTLPDYVRPPIPASDLIWTASTSALVGGATSISGYAYGVGFYAQQGAVVPTPFAFGRKGTSFPTQPAGDPPSFSGAFGETNASRGYTNTYTVGSLSLNLKALDASGAPITALSSAQAAPASDDDPATFDVRCTVPVDGAKFATVTVYPYDEPPLSTPTPTPAPTPTPTPTPTSLPTPHIEPTPTPTPPPTPVRTPGAPTPFPTPAREPNTTTRWAVTGLASLKNLTKGAFPLKGSLSTTTPVLAGGGGVLSGALALDPSSTQLVAYGFLPVRATVNIVQTSGLTGTQSPSSTDLRTTVRFKFPSVTLFGVQLGGGGTCQTKNPSALNLKRAGASGPLVATFAISDLSGCGSLTNIVSSLTAGSGNALTLTLGDSTSTTT